MKISIENCGEEVLYVVSEVPKGYEQILIDQYYSLDDGRYIKKYSSRIKNIQEISRNYLRYAEEMFKQMGYFTEVKWKEALQAFLERIEGTGIEWWLTGSCALALRGIPIVPHDVDIMLDSKDISKINEIFSDVIIEPIEATEMWVVKHFGVMFLNARIDIAFDPEDYVDTPHPTDFGPYAKKHLEEIVFKGYPIKIPPLQLQLEVNKRRGRSDRVKAIEDYLLFG